MKYDATMRLNSNEKDKKVALDKIAHGWESHITLPHFHTLPFEGKAGIEYISLNGLHDFIILPENEPRNIKALIRIANPGIVIENGTINNQQLRLPWASMIDSKIVGRNIYLKLDKNQHIKFSGFPVFRTEKFSLSFISKLIKDYIKSSKS